MTILSMFDELEPIRIFTEAIAGRHYGRACLRVCRCVRRSSSLEEEVAVGVGLDCSYSQLAQPKAEACNLKDLIR